MIEQVVLYLIGGLIFVFLQSLIINGVYEAFSGKCWDDLRKGKVCDGNIFYKMNTSFFERNKNKIWTLPLWGCVKCMASFWSLITFFPLVVYLFGFHWIEIYVWGMDAFSLVTLNYWWYKKL